MAEKIDSCQVDPKRKRGKLVTERAMLLRGANGSQGQLAIETIYAINLFCCLFDIAAYFAFQ